MPRSDVTVTMADGTCPATLHTPEGPGPWPAVIVYPDAGSVRESMQTIAGRIADMGYVALLPDVYYREGDWTPFDMDTVFSDEDERKRLMGLVGSLTNERVVSDAGAYLDFLADRPEVAGDAVGTTGYCMGGRISMIVAGAHPERVAAAASFHGGRLAVADDPTSPHHLAGQIRATVVVAGAQDDGSFGPEQFELLDRVLTDAGVTHTIETYPAAHGFAVPDNPTFDAAVAERHYAAMGELYGTVLGK